MKTLLQLGPADHDRPMTLEEFLAAEGAPGFKYELIEGKVYVSPAAEVPENQTELWLLMHLYEYTTQRPDVLNYVTNKARVFLPGRRRRTNPEPDLAAYRDFPLDQLRDSIRWRDLSPLLVAEVLGGDLNKDLVRNVALYLRVPSIREYWVADILQEGAERPHLRVHQRRGSRWRVRHFGPGDTYTTPLLPGFSLLIDPRK